MTLTIHNVEQRSAEWYELRRGVLTASVVGQLITPTGKVANNDTSRALTFELAAERLIGNTEPSFVNDDMMRGILDEPLAVEKYAEHYAPVTTTGFMLRTEDTWTLGYSPDGLVGDDGLIEVKCPRAKTHLRTILDQQMPARHMAQVQAGMLVSGRHWCDYISYYGGMPLFVKRIEASPSWWVAIVEACERFEQTVTQTLNDYESLAAEMPETESMEVVV